MKRPAKTQARACPESISCDTSNALLSSKPLPHQDQPRSPESEEQADLVSPGNTKAQSQPDSSSHTLFPQSLETGSALQKREASCPRRSRVQGKEKMDGQPASVSQPALDLVLHTMALWKPRVSLPVLKHQERSRPSICLTEGKCSLFEM